MPNLFKELRKRALRTPDVGELIHNDNPIFLFDAIHLKVNGKANMMIRRPEVDWLGRAYVNPEEKLIFKLTGDNKEPIMSRTAPHSVNRTIKGDLFKVNGLTISILDRFFMNGDWFKRESIEVYHKDHETGLLMIVNAFCYLATTPYWKSDVRSLGYTSAKIGTTETKNIDYFEYN